jgi:hypothetical protein
MRRCPLVASDGATPLLVPSPQGGGDAAGRSLHKPQEKKALVPRRFAGNGLGAPATPASVTLRSACKRLRRALAQHDG